jgi:hypothetical protein
MNLVCYFQNVSDPVIIALVQDVFKELSQNPECLSPLQQRLVPTLVSILNAPADKIPSGILKEVNDPDSLRKTLFICRSRGCKNFT